MAETSARSPHSTPTTAHTSPRCFQKTRLFALPFHTKNDHFTKTGSGQTQGNSQKSTVFLQTLVNFARKARPGFNFTSIQVNKNYLSVRKTPLFAPFVYKNEHFTKTGSGQT
jgi:hypothetical protein